MAISLAIGHIIEFFILLVVAPFSSKRIWIGSAESERKSIADLILSLEQQINTLRSKMAQLDENIHKARIEAERERDALKDSETAIRRWCDLPKNRSLFS